MSSFLRFLTFRYPLWKNQPEENYVCLQGVFCLNLQMSSQAVSFSTVSCVKCLYSTPVSHLWLCREFHGCVLSRPLPVGHVLNSHVLLQPYYADNFKVTYTALSPTLTDAGAVLSCSAQLKAEDFSFCFWTCLCLLCFALHIGHCCRSAQALQGVERPLGSPPGSPQPLSHLDIECPAHIQTFAPLLPYIFLSCFKDSSTALV